MSQQDMEGQGMDMQMEMDILNPMDADTWTDAGSGALVYLSMEWTCKL